MLQTLPLLSPSSLVLAADRTRLSYRANSTASSTAVVIDPTVEVVKQRDRRVQSASAYRDESGKSDWQSCLLGQLNSVAIARPGAFAVLRRITNRIDAGVPVVVAILVRQGKEVED